jgi:hypothetical protein
MLYVALSYMNVVSSAGAVLSPVNTRSEPIEM